MLANHRQAVPSCWQEPSNGDPMMLAGDKATGATHQTSPMRSRPRHDCGRLVATCPSTGSVGRDPVRVVGGEEQGPLSTHYVEHLGNVCMRGRLNKWLGRESAVIYDVLAGRLLEPRCVLACCEPPRDQSPMSADDTGDAPAPGFVQTRKSGTYRMVDLPITAQVGPNLP